MKRIILNIEESKFQTFLAFIETLEYVSISRDEPTPTWQQEEVNRRWELMERGEMEARSWDEAKTEIFKK